MGLQKYENGIMESEQLIITQLNILKKSILAN